MVFLECRSEEKTSILLYLLRSIIKADQQSVIFVATKHHVEYLNMVSVCRRHLSSSLSMVAADAAFFASLWLSSLSSHVLCLMSCPRYLNMIVKTPMNGEQQSYPVLRVLGCNRSLPYTMTVSHLFIVHLDLYVRTSLPALHDVGHLAECCPS